MDVIQPLIAKAKESPRRVVLPEGADGRILEAARRLKDDGIAVELRMKKSALESKMLDIAGLMRARSAGSGSAGGGIACRDDEGWKLEAVGNEPAPFPMTARRPMASPLSETALNSLSTRARLLLAGMSGG